MQTTEHAHHHPTHAGPGREAAMRWLDRQLRWEHLLAELRRPDEDDDTLG